MVHVHELDNFDMKPARLEREWLISIQTPVSGIEALLAALGEQVKLVQGAYDHCAFVAATGQQRFRAREGSHAGAEDTIQSTPVAEVHISIPADIEVLNRTFEIIYQVHVHEDPTIRVQEVWGARSKYTDDKDNPNRYWNRPDANEIHGTVIAGRQA